MRKAELPGLEKFLKEKNFTSYQEEKICTQIYLINTESSFLDKRSLKLISSDN